MPYTSRSCLKLYYAFVDANEKLIHQKYLEILVIEGYKHLNGLSPQIMNQASKNYLRYKKRSFI